MKYFSITSAPVWDGFLTRRKHTGTPRTCKWNLIHPLAMRCSSTSEASEFRTPVPLYYVSTSAPHRRNNGAPYIGFMRYVGSIVRTHVPAWTGTKVSQFSHIDQKGQMKYCLAMTTWPLAEAKARLSEVVEQALHHEPQQITRNGKPVALVVSLADWKRKHAKTRPKQNLADFFRDSPLVGSGIDLRRGSDESRQFDL